MDGRIDGKFSYMKRTISTNFVYQQLAIDFYQLFDQGLADPNSIALNLH